MENTTTKKPDLDRLEYLNKELNFKKTTLENVDWDYISQYKNLSEDFIREFQNEIEWRNVVRYQNVSLAFIKEFKHKMCSTYWKYFLQREDIHKQVVKLIIQSEII